MELEDAARLILVESGSHPTLMGQARFVYEEYAAGRRVRWEALSALIEEAIAKRVLATLREQSPETFDDVILTLGREIDRDAPLDTDERLRARARYDATGAVGPAFGGSASAV